MLTTAEYPGAIWMPAHPTNIIAGGRGPKTHVTIHCTDGHADPRGTAEMWQEPHHGSSAHFVVGQGGEVVQAASIDDSTWHAHTAGLSMIGIEHSARTPREWGPADPGMPPTSALYLASARLTAWLCRRFGLAPTRANILGHAEADPKTTHTRCPDGCGWNWARYMALVLAASRG